MCGCAGVCNEQNSHGTSPSPCHGLALFSTAPAPALWWIQGIRGAQGPCSQDQEKAPKAAALGLGHWAPCECVVWCMSRIPGSYSIISVWNNEVCKIWRLFPIHSKEPPQLFLILVTHSRSNVLVFLSWGKCSFKKLGWLVFLSVFLYLHGLMKKKIVSKTRIWLWFHSSYSFYTVFNCDPRPHALKLMESNQGFGSF